MHEIITLQLGQQSNYVATHFWNAQESYFTYSDDQESHINHDIHWRPGIGADGTETFMPRTVIYDLKGGFGSLRKINALYANQEGEGSAPMSLWNGPTSVLKQDAIEQSAYQQSLDAGLEPPPLTTSSVRYWSDFNRVYFHPRSIVQLNEYELNSSLMPFEKWESGEHLFESLDKEHDIVDRDLRLFVEEADQMQGIQIIATLDDAWGGFASRYIERLRDEYGKTVLWTWGLQDSLQGVPREKRMLRLGNKAKSLSEIYKQASIIVPLSVPSRLPRSISLDPSSQWHTSALLATAIESITLPSRLKDATNRDTLGSIVELLNPTEKQTIADLQMSFSSSEEAAEDSSRTPGRQSSSTNGFLLPDDDNLSEGIKLDINFTPSDQIDLYARQIQQQNGFRNPRVFNQVISRRGYNNSAAQDSDAMDIDSDAVEADQDDRNRRRRNNLSGPVTKIYKSTLRFPLLDSFPRNILRDTDTDTNTHTGGEPPAPAPLTSSSSPGSGINTTTSLSTSTATSARLKLLRTTVLRAIAVDTREVLGNDLADMAAAYQEDYWSSGSDEGEDD
ncbi:tubulin nucleotide-binding domain-like protein [Podospora didyma]|uniref:Tubulin nucleotide-binding domain-like protein n=1 Tax=Podospora didyma TaxID=330526 RepID=A0AAE0K1C4_9PEZI|nr:tubulin nucleotide-binding domain-like protein [Podospora didyma]